MNPHTHSAGVPHRDPAEMLARGCIIPCASPSSRSSRIWQSAPADQFPGRTRDRHGMLPAHAAGGGTISCECLLHGLYDPRERFDPVDETSELSVKCVDKPLHCTRALQSVSNAPPKSWASYPGPMRRISDASSTAFLGSDSCEINFLPIDTISRIAFTVRREYWTLSQKSRSL